MISKFYFKRSTVLSALKRLPLFVFIISSPAGYGQAKIATYVKENTVKIESIEPGFSGYADLEVIGNAIGDARIVMLGEQDHGDAPTFLAKTRIIKYLHEKKGFNVLAFESDFFAMNYNWQFVKSGNLSMDSFLVMNISHMWTSCSACFPLFRQYLPDAFKKGFPVMVTGFDNQMGTTFLMPLLDSVLQQLKIPITEKENYKATVFPLLTTWYKYTHDSSTTDKIISYYKEIKKELLEKLPENDFWVLTIENLIQENLQFRNWKKDYWKDMNVRDRQMAVNLRWLMETKYPDEKIIVWAHNYHVSKYAGHYPEDFLNNANTMGTVFTQNPSSMERTYIIGFTSYEGSAGRLFGKKTYKIKKPGKNSFEHWVDQSYKYSFTDFKKYNTEEAGVREGFYMAGATKGNRYHTSQQAIWNKIFDGVFFIREMYPCVQ